METYSFGQWSKQRRQALRLTQREVAAAVFCSTAMIKKIEADERRPSPELAQGLAAVLQLPAEQHEIFVACARGERPLDDLPLSPRQTSAAPQHLPPSTLPTPATPFLGRTAELADLVARLRRPDCRLLTLLGPGGIGKTRLALAAARAAESAFADGAIFVPLAALNDAAQIPQAILEALRLPLSGDEPPLAQAQRRLQRRHLLLVLDNLEQLASGAGLLSALLAAAPGVTMLVTSRERLNLTEEWLFPVPALDEATALFNQTAMRVKPDFDAQAEETAVRHICRLVDGHPLAVELAASWTRYLACDQIAAQIAQDFDFLARAARNVPERHRSLRALFDHSWRLLTAEERAALASLSVFRGGFALEEATAVAGASHQMLLGLVDKSLLEMRGDRRFDLHELTRQYAAARLDEAGQTEAAHAAHFAAYAALAKRLSDWFTSPRAAASFRQSAQEHENYRAALRWGLAQAPIEAVLELVHHLFAFWLRGGHWQEGERWMEAAVAKAPEEDAVYLCLALAQQGVFAALQGHYARADPKTQRAYRMARRLEEPWPLVVTLQIQGQSLLDKERSLAAFAEAISICEERLDDPRFNNFLGSLLGLRGDRLLTFGRVDEARASLEASVAHLRALGDSFWIAYPLGNLGRMALHDGDLDKAQQLIGESVAITRASGNRGGIADWLFRLGQVYLYRRDLRAAEEALQETLRLYEETDNGSGPVWVLSTLALVALEGGDVETAVTHVRDGFSRYRKLLDEVKQIRSGADLWVGGDAGDALLLAGLVAHAQGEWQHAQAFFSFFEQYARGYRPIRPLEVRVAAAADEVRTRLGPAAYKTAVAAARQLSLDELLALPLA